MNRSRPFVRALGIIFGLLLTFPVVAAESLDEIYAIADRKDFDTALKRLNQFLTDHPQDAQARFLKGLILTETKQRDQAISVFQQLSKDFPELPEPYNNLAVLYAEQGQFEKAQEALNQAVKAHPNYATAHENLGDIHAKMASQAYARALKLNPGNNALTGKLNKVKTLFTESAEQPSAKAGQVKSQSGVKSQTVKTDPPPPKPASPVESAPVKPALTAQADTPQASAPASVKSDADKDKESVTESNAPKTGTSTPPAASEEGVPSDSAKESGGPATRKTVSDSAKIADP
ncbi:MAG: tetratricopeptide repeat protein, partial [Magnetococcales bacterium]|nr:tetratricopeptide repeat protein [Magnetococcales bacterium]